MVFWNGTDEPSTDPEAPERAPRRLRRRLVTAAVVVGAAAGVAVGATALAGAATAPTTTQPGANGSTPATPPGPGGHFGGHGFGGFGGAFAGGMGGPVVHGQYTIKGPNGYETIDERTGTVSAVSNSSGSTWSLTVKSADGSSGTFTVNSSTSVNGGESGIASVKSGDTVVVTGTVSGGTTTATRITDTTTLKANGKSWLPMRGQMSPAPGSGTAPAPS
jgi:hypothetical protein